MKKSEFVERFAELTAEYMAMLPTAEREKRLAAAERRLRMSAHTPGPWRILEEEMANFRLIAAAPDLLAVLKEAEQIINGAYALAEWLQYCRTEVTDEVRERIAAAIAKAEERP